MSVSRLRALLILAGIAFVGLTAWSLRYFSRYQPLSAFGAEYAQPGLGEVGLRADDVLVVAHEGGRRRWRVAARTLTFSRDRRTVRVDSIRQGLLYDPEGKPEVSLTAGHVVYSTPLGTVGASPIGTLRVDTNVRAVVLSAQRPTLDTQVLVWDALRGELSSPGPLTATMPRLAVSAGSGVYDRPPGPAASTPEGTLRLSDGIHATVHSPRGVFTLDCPGLAWEASKNAARSLGPVTAQVPGGLGTATAAAVEADTKTGDVTLHGLRGTLRLPREVQ